MNENGQIENDRDGLDGLIASALADESAWPSPRPGMEERFERRMSDSRTRRRAYWASFRTKALKAAAGLAVAFGVVYGVSVATVGGNGDASPNTAAPAARPAVAAERTSDAALVVDVVCSVFPQTPSSRAAGMILSAAADVFAAL